MKKAGGRLPHTGQCHENDIMTDRQRGRKAGREKKPPPETPETPPPGEARLRVIIAEQAALIRDLLKAFANFASCVAAEAQAKRGDSSAKVGRDELILGLWHSTDHDWTEGQIADQLKLPLVVVKKVILRKGRRKGRKKPR